MDTIDDAKFLMSCAVYGGRGGEGVFVCPKVSCMNKLVGDKNSRH